MSDENLGRLFAVFIFGVAWWLLSRKSDSKSDNNGTGVSTTKSKNELKVSCYQVCGSFVAAELYTLMIQKRALGREFNENEKQKIFAFVQCVIGSLMDQLFTDNEIDDYLFNQVFGTDSGYLAKLGLQLNRSIQKDIEQRLRGDPEMILTLEKAKECSKTILHGGYQPGSISMI